MGSRWMKNSWILLLMAFMACAEEKTGTETIIDIEANTEVTPDVSNLDLAWLVGNWKDSTTWSHLNKQIIERWYLEDNVLYGTGLQVSDVTDTVLVESLNINTGEQPVNFVARVKEQNQGQGIAFALKSYGADSVRFENLGHDFPQIIIYKKITADSIHATAAGYTSNGALRRQTSKMVRY